MSINLTEYGRHSGAWRHPQADVSQIPNLAAYQHACEWAEKGFFDQGFLADSPVHTWGPTSTTTTRLDAMEMAGALAASTTHLGLIATMSTSYTDPYEVARRGASLSNLSGGRIGLNFVASQGDEMARNYQLANENPRPVRYARYREYLEVVTRLWDAAPDGDGPGERVSFHGEHLDLEATLDVAKPAHGRPIIVQAGQSAEGRDLAARWADAIYAAGTTVEHGREYYADIKRRAAAYGRDPDGIKVIMGIAPFIGETTAEAHELRHLLDDFHAEGADTIAHLSRVLEHDLSGYDPAGPLPFDELPEVRSASVGMATMFVRIAREEGLTLEQIAYRSYVGGLANMQFISTGDPVHVADEMQLWYETGAADGFSLVAPNVGPTMENFVSLVVPILQERGVARTSYEATSLPGHFGLTAPLDPRHTLPAGAQSLPL
ncbi:NtaA/DmoA family FMN-dependent monooxygenase [Nocardioides bruguierae]|uniref:NtaA/DmoA family FMN-dependent monooxygenase n=1 Tax=Nocardioides bruguierae TaxID=2945102 RepID=A0A9X2IES4_9ACTN|nr:NtaA/DmoA family FMN-dependent monooxygenase [Nocardioides bruguierae]MCM0621126.1 NtaA/DmoA family FMN-dependent monooxygenase [Nocardioides bruguierae]